MFTKHDGQAPGVVAPRFSSDTSKPRPDRVRLHTPAASNATASMIASFAMNGHIVIRGDRGDFSVTKYGLSRYCKDFAELATFAKIVGAAQ